MIVFLYTSSSKLLNVNIYCNHPQNPEKKGGKCLNVFLLKTEREEIGASSWEQEFNFTAYFNKWVPMVADHSQVSNVVYIKAEGT